MHNDYLRKFAMEGVSGVRFGSTPSAIFIDLYGGAATGDFVRLEIGYTATAMRMRVYTYINDTLGTVYTISPNS